MPSIPELAKKLGGFQKAGNKKIAEPSPVRSLPVIDNASPTESNVRTSVDAYVTGQYTSPDGGVIEVTQRYTIFVAYSRETQNQTMQQLRNRIIQHFQQEYGANFNVVNTHVDELQVPVQEELPGTERGEVAPMQMYGGSNLFREMTRYEKARYDIGTQEEQAETNIENIKERYDVEDEDFGSRYE